MIFNPQWVLVKGSLKRVGLLLAKYAGLLALARYITRYGVVIVGWHGVSMDDEHHRFSEYFISPQTLSRRLAFLQKHFVIISLDEAIRQHTSGRIGRRQVVLTFDDGLYNFTAAAVPVLKQYQATATLYVVSSMMHNALACKMALTDVLKRSKSEPGAVLRNTERALPFEQHLQLLKSMSQPQKEAYLLQFAGEAGVEFQSQLERRMWNHHTPDELKALTDDGFDVQVHTHSHKTVIDDPESVYEEASTCRRLIEEATNKPATDYCYPSGLWDVAAWEPLRKAGMRSAVTCKLGPNFVSTPILALRRYIDNEQMRQLDFEALVSGLPWLLHVVFNPTHLSKPSVAQREGSPYF